MSENKHEPSGLQETLHCSFCNKSQNEVRKLIAGPTVFICDECVEFCMDIVCEGVPNEITRLRTDVKALLEASEEVEEAHGQFAISSMFNSDNSREAKARGKDLSDAIQRLSDAIAKARGETE